MPRVSPQDAREFMDEFMDAMHTQFPKLVIQHEDFATERAFEVCMHLFSPGKLCVNLGRIAVSFKVSIQVPNVQRVSYLGLFCGCGSSR